MSFTIVNHSYPFHHPVVCKRSFRLTFRVLMKKNIFGNTDFKYALLLKLLFVMNLSDFIKGI